MWTEHGRKPRHSQPIRHSPIKSLSQQLTRQHAAVILSHSTESILDLLIPKPFGSHANVSLPLVIMLVAAIGAVALTVAALPALDRFIRW